MARKSAEHAFEQISMFVFKDHRAEGKVLLELNRQKNDRAVAIVGAAFLQTVLLDALQSHLRGDKPTFEKIFNPGVNAQTIANQIVVLEDGTVMDFYTEITEDFIHYPWQRIDDSDYRIKVAPRVPLS